jgi:hypothetical protein
MTTTVFICLRWLGVELVLPHSVFKVFLGFFGMERDRKDRLR